MFTSQGLTLQVLAGPTPGPFRVEGDGPAVLGRSGASDIVLSDDGVSRRHATLVRRRDVWYVVDEGSRGGTVLNGVRLPKSFPAPLGSGDLLRIGPWAMRVVIGQAATTKSAPTLDDSASRTQRIERLASTQRASLSDRRLKLLGDCIGRLSDATDEAAAAAIALELVLQGSGYSRGAVLRRVEGAHAAEVEVVSVLRTPGADQGEMTYSRTLIEQAAAGEPVLLTEDAEIVDRGQSIAEMGVHSAICVPISVNGPVTGYLYLDARGRESQVRSDAAGFCEAVATALGLAVSAMKRAELERRQRELHVELEAAREVQTLVMPELTGTVGPARYAIQSRPGSFVAGDLFDMLALPDGRVAMCIGDVAGHGVGSAMLMATAQAFLNAELRRLDSVQGPARAVAALNQFLTSRPLAGRFLSLWVGVLAPDGELRYTDAGHGHWLLVQREGSLRRPILQMTDGGIPIGIDPGAEYGEGITRLSRREEIVLYSDGIVEQRGPAGVFGVDRLLAEVVAGQDVEEDVRLVMAALEAFAGTPTWDDDATIAAVEFLGN